MKVQCIYQKDAPLLPELLAIGYAPEVVIDVVRGQVFTVYSICQWKGMIHYLIINGDIDRPVWFPAVLFDVVDSSLPDNWHHAYWGNRMNAPATAVWGYPEMSESGGKHYVGLIERESDDLKVFAARRDEIDSEMTNRSPR